MTFRGHIPVRKRHFGAEARTQPSEMEKRFCKVCQEELHGRRDKQYCSDYCRATYFNQTNAGIAGYMRKINYAIRRNRSILCELNPGGKSRVHKRKLIDHGLNFEYFTNIYRTRSGKTYYFCYDQGYVELEDEYFALVVKENYVN